jgi:hypothetical protein
MSTNSRLIDDISAQLQRIINPPQTLVDNVKQQLSDITKSSTSSNVLSSKGGDNEHIKTTNFEQKIVDRNGVLTPEWSMSTTDTNPLTTAIDNVSYVVDTWRGKISTKPNKVYTKSLKTEINQTANNLK